MITLIAAIGRNREIGFENKLLWSIPEDMKHFKSYTMGKVIIMGRKTFAGIGNKPLPGRKSVVVSTHDLHGAAVWAKDIDSALSIDYCYPEIVVIGGESIYKQTIDRADKLVITHVDADFKADTFFPEIDLTKWKINSTLQSSNDQFEYRFVEYIRNENSGNP
jgi:dihydrofolate reductase